MPLSQNVTRRSKEYEDLEEGPRRRQRRGKSGKADEYIDVCVLVVAVCRVVEDAHLCGSGRAQK